MASYYFPFLIAYNKHIITGRVALVMLDNKTSHDSRKSDQVIDDNLVFMRPMVTSRIKVRKNVSHKNIQKNASILFQRSILFIMNI